MDIQYDIIVPLLLILLLVSVLGVIWVLVKRAGRIRIDEKTRVKLALENAKKGIDEKKSFHKNLEKQAEKEEVSTQKELKTPSGSEKKEKPLVSKKKKLEKIKNQKSKKRDDDIVLKEETKEEGVTDEETLVISIKEIKNLVSRADILISQKNHPEAEKILIQVLSYDENYVPALKNLAQLYLELENYSKSGILWERILEKHPKDPSVHTNLALSHFHEKNFDKAIEYYQYAINHDDQNPLRYSNLGQVYFALKKYNEAIDHFHCAVNRQPRNLEYLYLVADAYRSVKRFPEAKKWYEKILDVSPYDKEAQKEIERLEALGF